MMMLGFSLGTAMVLTLSMCTQQFDEVTPSNTPKNYHNTIADSAVHSYVSRSVPREQRAMFSRGTNKKKLKSTDIENINISKTENFNIISGEEIQSNSKLAEIQKVEDITFKGAEKALMENKEINTSKENLNITNVNEINIVAERNIQVSDGTQTDEVDKNNNFKIGNKQQLALVNTIKKQEPVSIIMNFNILGKVKEKTNKELKTEKIATIKNILTNKKLYSSKSLQISKTENNVLVNKKAPENKIQQMVEIDLIKEPKNEQLIVCNNNNLNFVTTRIIKKKKKLEINNKSFLFIAKPDGVEKIELSIENQEKVVISAKKPVVKSGFEKEKLQEEVVKSETIIEQNINTKCKNLLVVDNDNITIIKKNTEKKNNLVETKMTFSINVNSGEKNKKLSSPNLKISKENDINLMDGNRKLKSKCVINDNIVEIQLQGKEKASLVIDKRPKLSIERKQIQKPLLKIDKVVNINCEKTDKMNKLLIVQEKNLNVIDNLKKKVGLITMVKSNYLHLATEKEPRPIQVQTVKVCKITKSSIEKSVKKSDKRAKIVPKGINKISIIGKPKVQGFNGKFDKDSVVGIKINGNEMQKSNLLIAKSGNFNVISNPNKKVGLLLIREVNNIQYPAPVKQLLMENVNKLKVIQNKKWDELYINNGVIAYNVIGKEPIPVHVPTVNVCQMKKVIITKPSNKKNVRLIYNSDFERITAEIDSITCYTSALIFLLKSLMERIGNFVNMKNTKMLNQKIEDLKSVKNDFEYYKAVLCNLFDQCETLTSSIKQCCYQNQKFAKNTELIDKMQNLNEKVKNVDLFFNKDPVKNVFDLISSVIKNLDSTKKYNYENDKKIFDKYIDLTIKDFNSILATKTN